MSESDTRGWQPPAATPVDFKRRARGLTRAVIAPALSLARRGGNFVVWTPEALGGGNHLYMWFFAWSETRQGRPTKILQRDGMEGWLQEFPALRAFTVTNENVPFRDRRGVVWNQDYQNSTILDDFLTDCLLSSESFQKRLESAQSSIQDSSAVLNVRRGDYYTNTEIARNYSMDQRFLFSLVQTELENAGIKQLEVVSDDAQWCRENVPKEFPSLPVSVRELGVFDTLALLAAAPTLVLSNSTFSYWGGYLNECLNRDASQVFAPQFHSRNSVGGLMWQQSPQWTILENVSHEMDPHREDTV